MINFWLARDEDGCLTMFYEEPKKVMRSGKGVFTCENDGFCSMEIYAWEYPEVTYENSPVKLTVTPELKPPQPGMLERILKCLAVVLGSVALLFLVSYLLTIRVVAITLMVIIALVILVAIVYAAKYGGDDYCDYY